jgi:hypothetical protein
MSGLRRATRHPDRLGDPHARAKVLASDRLVAALSAEDGAWLGDHLEGCSSCRRVADSFAADHARILALRDELPVPPRDLGARLSRALDVEVRRAVREDARRGRRSPSGSVPFALSAIAVAAVLAIVFLPLALAGFGIGNAPVAPVPGGSGGPAATPMTVASQPVTWVQRQTDGSYVLTTASVDEVCPGLDASACGTLDGAARQVVALSVEPSAVVLQHNGTSAVLVSRDALYSFTVPRDAGVTPTPPSSSPIPKPGVLSPTPAVTGVGATPPAATPVPTGSPRPRSTPTRQPATARPAVSASPTPDASVAATSPIPTATSSGAPAATALASEAPTPATSIVSIPPASPAPSAAVTTPVIENVTFVGASPAYSPDGQWVAFSARPSDGALGPDIYAWHVGDRTARPLTTDHASVFSAWTGDQILGSVVLPAGSPPSQGSPVTIAPPASPTPDASAFASSSPDSQVPVSPSAGAPAPASAAPGHASPAASASTGPAVHSGSATASATLDAAQGATPSPGDASMPPSVPVGSFLVDPSTGAQAPIVRPGIWRPVVDPTNRSVVFWAGDQVLDPATDTLTPTNGRLVVADWQALIGPGEVTATPLPGSAGLAGVATWEVRWDPSGRHLAVWIADAADPSVGQLNLFAVNADGSVGDTLLADIAALPGLSLASDRLAWASPPGQNGQGSTLSVYVWSEGGSGSLSGAPDPGPDPLVVAR